MRPLAAPGETPRPVAIGLSVSVGLEARVEELRQARGIEAGDGLALGPGAAVDAIDGGLELGGGARRRAGGAETRRGPSPAEVGEAAHVLAGHRSRSTAKNAVAPGGKPRRPSGLAGSGPRAPVCGSRV